SGNVADHHRCSASHRLKKNVWPAFVPRSKHKNIGSGVEGRKALLRHVAHECNAISNSLANGKLLQRSLLWTFAYYHKARLRKVTQGFNHEVVPLQGHQVSDRKKCEAVCPNLPSTRISCAGPKHFDVDTVAQDGHPTRLHAKLDEALPKRGRNGNQACRSIGGPPNHPARERIMGQHVDIAAARRDGDRTPEILPEHDGGDTVRVEIVRINQIKFEALRNHSAQCATRGSIQRERSERHA